MTNGHEHTNTASHDRRPSTCTTHIAEHARRNGRGLCNLPSKVSRRGRWCRRSPWPPDPGPHRSLSTASLHSNRPSRISSLHTSRSMTTGPHTKANACGEWPSIPLPAMAAAKFVNLLVTGMRSSALAAFSHQSEPAFHARPVNNPLSPRVRP